MGLAEKRAAKEFQEKKWGEIKKQIVDTVGFEVPIQVDWDSLTWEGHADYYTTRWSDGCFGPLVAALKSICSDDLGKSALKVALKRINVLGNYFHNLKAEFKDGTLLLDFRFSNDIGGPASNDFKERVKSITDALEKAL